MKIIMLLGLVLVGLGFSGCAGDYDYEIVPVQEMALEDVLRVARGRREGIVKPGYEVLQGLVEDRRYGSVFPSELGDYNASSNVYYFEALGDAAVLFALLSEVYGAYTYFGGDYAFEPIFENIFQEINSRDYWYFEDLEELFYRELRPVIFDNHFWIGDRVLDIRYQFMRPIASNPNSIMFGRSADGFYNLYSGEYVYEVLINDEPAPDDIFRLSITDEGEFYYGLVFKRRVQIPASRVNLEIVYQNGDVVRFPTGVAPSDFAPFQEPTLTWVDDIPIITIMQMGFNESTTAPSAEGARDFLSFAQELRNEPTIIIDIRNNRGGNGLLPHIFLYELLGEIVLLNSIQLRMQSYDELMYVLNNQNYDSIFYVSVADMVKFFNPEPFDERHIVQNNKQREIIQNEPLLVFLTGRGAGSAADGFADLALNLENSLIIGQNTAGVLHTDLTYPSLFLPKSNIRVGFGRSIFVHPENHLPEGVGISPDIWAMGDALQAALSLIANNTNGGN